jgi:hypothetical protein
VLDHDTSRRIEVRLRANAAMSYDSTVRVSGGNDRDASNNVANVHLQINAATELRVTTVQTPVAGFTREPIAFSYLVSAGGVQTSPGVTVVITAGGVIINSATAAGATCTNLNTSQVTCALGDMAPGTSRRIDLSATATYAFSFSASAKATSTNMANYTASVGVRIDVASAQDAAVRLDPRIRTVTINEPFTASANLESAGPQAVNDVVLTILPSPQLVINSVIAPGGTCTSSAPFTCSFATLATGTASRIDVNAVATEFGLHHVSFRVVAQGDDEARNDFGDINVQANFAADIKVYPFENFYARETQTLRMFTRMSSAGVRAAENVSMTFNLPESLSIVSIASTTASCSNSERTATCTLPSLAPGSEALVQYEVQSTRVGTFSASAVVSAGNDGDSSNNQQAVKIEIGPFMDAALVPSTLPTHVETEDSFDVPLTVTTNGYPMADATLGVYTQLDVISVSAPGTCETVSPSYICHLGDLPANASIPIALRLRASKSGPYSVMLALNVLNDMFDTNNRLVFSVTARKHGDAAVQLGSQQLTSPVNRRTAFPEITVTGMTTVDDVVVRIGMPVTVYAESLSLDGQGGSCQVGNSEVLCSLGTVTADTPRHINFDIAGSRGGTFVSDVTLTSALDENPGNNQASVSMRFEGSTGGGGAGDAGGGGGGALEWTSLACLIAGLARRRRTPGYRERPEYS